MTITYVGAGAAATGNNASVAPALPAGLAAGDLMLLHASIRNSGTGTVDTPTGWTQLYGSGTNHAVFGRWWQSGDAAPTVSFTGGAAGADTIGQVAAIRGAAPGSLLEPAALESLLNASAQNVAYPATSPPADNEFLLVAAWKQDDVSSVAGPAGFTAITTTSTTTGDDSSQTWRYQIQTTATDLAAGSLTYTGGAAAISRSVVLAFRPAAALAATVQDVWPPRVLLSLTGLQVGDSVELYRVVGGERTLVRAGDDPGVSDPSFLRVDAELPFGVPVHYLALVDGVDEYTTDPVTYALPGGKVALTDAITGLAAEVVVLAWPDKTYDRDSSTFRVGRNVVVVSGDLTGYTATVELFCETYAGRDAVFELVDAATEGVVQIRQPGGYSGVDAYWAVTGAVERRWSQDGSDERRIVALNVTEVEGWAPALEARGTTLQDIADAYSGLTLQTIGNDYTTLLDLAEADFS